MANKYVEMGGQRVLLVELANGDLALATASGGSAVAPQLDDTDKLAVSLYGKGVAAGDTAVILNASGDVGIAVYGIDTDQDALGNDKLLLLRDATNVQRKLITVSYPHLFNDSNWDRQRNNHEVTALASAARTASVNSADLVNYNARGVSVVIDVTAITATPSVVFTLSGKDTLSGQYVAILASAAIVATGTTRLTVYPGVTVAANLAASAPLPRIWRVEAVAGDADSITYSVGCNYCS